MNTIKINKNKTQMVAHRGVSGIEKENTILSFVAAGNRTYYGIECDVYVTKDNKVVVMHDNNTGRVSPEKLNIKESTYEELKKLSFYDVEGKEVKDYYKIPLLSEYLDVCERYEKIAVVEIKDHISQEEIDIILDVVEKSGYLNNTIFISFYPWNLFKVRAKYPNQAVQFLSNEMNEKIYELCFTHRFDLDIRHDLVTQELIDNFHNQGLVVNTWTVNEKDEAEKFCAMGIDFITTNILE